MKTYQNTFETLGEPFPAKAESAEDYAEAYRETLGANADGFVRVDKPLDRPTGYAHEIRFWREVWHVAEHDDDDETGLIAWETLRAMIAHAAIEEVEEEKGE